MKGNFSRQVEKIEKGFLVLLTDGLKILLLMANVEYVMIESWGKS